MTTNSAIASQEFTGIFERKEKKFLIEQKKLEAFLSEIHSHLTPDERGITQVSSLYYDTPENTLISRSLEKPTYKEKLRVRAYGDVTRDSVVFVELKKKFKGIVYKRRFACSLSDAYLFMEGNDVKPISLETGASTASLNRNLMEVKACRDRYFGLTPKMLIVTNRLALYSNDDSDVRMTIDFEPRFDNENLKLEGHAKHKKLIDDCMCILEIKCANALPLWMISALSKMQIHSQSFSKYGHAFKISHDANLIYDELEQRSNVSGHRPKHAQNKEVACV